MTLTSLNKHKTFFLSFFSVDSDSLWEQNFSSSVYNFIKYNIFLCKVLFLVDSNDWDNGFFYVVFFWIKWDIQKFWLYVRKSFSYSLKMTMLLLLQQGELIRVSLVWIKVIYRRFFGISKEFFEINWLNRSTFGRF